MITFKTAMMIMIPILVVVLLFRKTKGLKGTWDNREDIEEFAMIVGDADDQGENKRKAKKITVAEKFVIPDATNGANESIGEKICRKHLEDRLNVKFVKERPDFLKNPITNTNLELDCFSSKLRLAVEYNGKQHYEFVPRFHKTKNDFYNQKYRDEIKKRLCYENGIDLIEVPFTISHAEIPLYIDSALEKLGRLKLV